MSQCTTHRCNFWYLDMPESLVESNNPQLYVKRLLLREQFLPFSSLNAMGMTTVMSMIILSIVDKFESSKHGRVQRTGLHGVSRHNDVHDWNGLYAGGHVRAYVRACAFLCVSVCMYVRVRTRVCECVYVCA